MILTDIVVFSAWPKFKPQGERREELKFLRELQGPVGRMGSIALPALETFGRVVAGTITIVVDHVENVPFRPLLRNRVNVVRTVDVQIIINANVYVVVSPVEPAMKTETKEAVMNKPQEKAEHIQYDTLPTQLFSCVCFMSH